MMQKFTLHTHTIGFDGRSAPREMIMRAAELGMHTIGISNHFIVHPNIKSTPLYDAAVRGGYNVMYTSSFDEVMARFVPHYAELENLASEFNIRVLRGMEVDFFDTPAWHRGFAAACRELRPDYLIGSAHFVEYNDVLCNVHDMKNAATHDQDAMLRQYWQNIANAANSGLFNWMAHLDLPRKVGLGTDDKWVPCENAALDAVAAAGIAIELNTKGMHPSARILRGAATRNIPVFISDDAHVASDLGRDFDVAPDILAQSGVKILSDVDEILKFA